MGGIQSHNQREHESRSNKEIDYEKSAYNIDTVIGSTINYKDEIKGRIAQLNLPKAVRKDAVVYCSMMVSSDRIFFEGLCAKEHLKRESLERENVAIGLEPPTPFEIMPQEYQEDCFRVGALNYFQKATEFFQDRYGINNVVNGTVHFDEATPHMHLGLVPVTVDGRLSAKTLFTPLELKQLQTEFANKVGSKFGLERGVEGSQATHLDEVTFKLKKRQEQFEKISEQVQSLDFRQFQLSQDCSSLEQQKKTLLEQAESLSNRVSALTGEVALLDTQKRLMERVIAQLEDYKEWVEKAIASLTSKISGKADFKREIQKQRAIDYIEKTGKMADFDDYCQSSTRNRSRGSKSNAIEK